MRRRRALIVDDERLARQELRRLLASHSEIEIVGEADNGEAALRASEELTPDVVFLDIQMPGIDGFGVVERLSPMPHVIFTTAYDEFALRAFEASAIDYLLKPIAAARLARAIEKLPTLDAPPLHHLFVKDGDRCWFLKPTDLVLLESEGNYTRLYFPQAGARPPLLLRSLQALEDRLPAEEFFRANRRQLIRLDHVRNVTVGMAEQLLVTLSNGVEVEMSRRQSAAFKARLSL
jgi:two-component system LytT family response regulator